MEIDKTRTVAFSGHRSFKMAARDNLFSPNNDAAGLAMRISQAIRQLHASGYDTFLCGMAEGFDLMAGLEVLKLRDEFPEIRLFAIIPFPGQADSFSQKTRNTYDYILAKADCQTTICPYYSQDCFHRRNDFLIDNCSVLACYYNGSKGGTAYTVKRALKYRIRVINILL